MLDLTPVASVNVGEMYQAKYDGRVRTFEYLGESDDGDALISSLLDKRTTGWDEIEIVRHTKSEHFSH